MSSTPRAVLIELFAAYGRPLLSAPRILEGLLKDYCGEFRREIFVLVSCAKAGVPDQLLQQSGPSIKFVCGRLALKLEQNLAISGDIARWAVESWALALDLLPPEETTERLSNTIGLLPGTAPAEVEAEVAETGPAHETTSLPNVPALANTAPIPQISEPPIIHEDDAIEALAVEPESTWPVPDWSHPETNIVVYPDDTGQKPTLRDAVREAAANTCILLRPGNYRASLVIKRNLQIRAADLVRGATIESHTTSSVISLDGACLFLCHLTLKGVPARDTKILPTVEVKAGHLVMEDCDITSEIAAVVEVKGPESEAILRRCYLHDGKAGGIAFQDSSVGYLEDCHLFRNKLSQVAIGKGCAPTLTGCKISHSAMAGIYISEAGGGLIEDCDIWGSEVGGIQCRRGGKPHVRLSRISTNQRYGILVTDKGEGFFERCQIFDNAHAGVVVSQEAQPRFSFCQIFDNRQNGVELDEQGAGEWLDCEIFTNRGANIAVKRQSNPAFYRCVIHDGRREGAVVTSVSRGKFERCEFFANALAGAVIAQEAAPVFSHSVFHDGAQSGVVTSDGARGRFIDCEITRHAAPAIVAASRAETEFERCHLLDNRAAGVEILEDGAPRLIHCVIRNNQGAGISVHPKAGGSAEKCEVTGNIGDDWVIVPGASFARA